MTSPDRFVVSVLDDYQGVAADCADWASLGPDVDVRFHRQHIDSDNRLVDALKGSHVIVAMRERTPLRAHVLDRLDDLRLVVTTGMRNESIDHVPGLPICGTRGLVSPTVELTWALLLAARRRLIAESAALRGGHWQTAVGDGLEGTTLGVLGLGGIGARVAKIAKAFGMTVLAWSQHLTAERAEEIGVAKAESLGHLFANAAIVSIHLRLSDRTRGLVSIAELDQLGPDGLLVNTSRAQIVDQDDLVEALRAGRLGGAALDVYDQEPLPRNHPILAVPRTTLTPHLGYVTRQNYELFFSDVVEDIVAFRAGNPIRLIADNS
ncbi:D-2-hydroxyacid dehydrogenase family protein [Mycobacterium neglectum]|uniref:D-2-hydroxyacid dehydrogenase family protein n=1 Tax=Mycobacterium neglectum TaxID=242737 RepID=UPI000BFF0D98|nr:D-2-hydroxyacid dehydrogenase family protein [Mycobacterium neglectum]